MTDPRVLTPARVEDDAQDEGLRPRRLDDYIGQDRIREQLQVAIEAAKGRGEALDHTLLYGRRVSARRHSPMSLPTNSACRFGPRPDR